MRSSSQESPSSPTRPQRLTAMPSMRSIFQASETVIREHKDREVQLSWSERIDLLAVAVDELRSIDQPWATEARITLSRLVLGIALNNVEALDG